MRAPLNKTLLIPMVLLFVTARGYTQSVTVEDLIKLSVYSHSYTTKYLTGEKQFKFIPIKTKYNIVVSQYGKGEGKSNELIVKTQWVYHNREIPSIDYEFKDVAYLEPFLKQVQQFGFKLASEEKDANKHVRLYDNGAYTLSVYTYTEKKLPVSTELHGK
jgi:hypothetical protein